MQEDSQTVCGDAITKARLDRRDIIISKGKRGGVSFEVVQIPLDYYLRRRLITPTEHKAGNRLFIDFSISGQVAGSSLNLNPNKSGIKEFTQTQLDARERWRNALEAVSGVIGKMMIINVCCYGYWIKDIQYRYYRNPQDAMSRFHEALADLIAHYDLTRNSR